MSNKEMFYKLCNAIVTIKVCIDTIESIGLLVDSDNGVGSHLYSLADTLYFMASSFLNYDNLESEEKTFNQLSKATPETIREITEKVWDEYGVK